MTRSDASDDDTTERDSLELEVDRSNVFDLEVQRDGDALELVAPSTEVVWLAEALSSFGFEGQEVAAEVGDRLRLTSIDEEDGEPLRRALETILAPEALFLDLDGVLADVTDSYRTAIVETCASFGVDLSLEEVSRFKSEGDANNDWVLIERILEQRGVDVEVDEVKARHDALYHGEGDEPGLWQRETMIPSESLIASLGERLQLGIVTGRTRRSATRFLEHTWIDRYVEACVCLEDAPRKPNPEPVELLAAQMGVDVSRGWLVGDTPDDVLAARRADALPFGIVSPSDEPEAMRPALEESGVARVLSRLDGLLELLP